ncbi:MAG: HAMP domain-containing histidine kinase, partial [Erysipelotrichaceae bacterium]|nr:HAMP domain-containing histidine kinase [Erysipelotrichaceae bacterium]
IVELAAEGGEKEVYTYNYGTGKTGLTAEFFGYDVLGMHGAIETHDGKLINADDFAQKHVVRFMVYDPLVTEDEFLKGQRNHTYFSDNINKVLITTAVAFVLAILDLVWILYSSGYDVHYEGLHMNWFDRIPLDLLTIGIGTYEFSMMLVAREVFNIVESYYVDMVGVFTSLSMQLPFYAVAIAAGLGILAWLITVVKRLKYGNGEVYKNTIIYRAVKWIWDILVNLKLIWKFALGAFIVMMILMFSLEENNEFLAVTVSGLAMLYMAWWFISASRVKTAAERIAAGDVDYELNTKWMPYDIRKHYEELTSLQDGLKVAVEKQMRSEHLKTDLITNVSHDIKTPLTSIINYVDLLQKEHTPEEEEKYLEVLSRQSNRLKKLTEDLIEASKASTGNISMELTSIDVKEILEQSLAEYKEKFDANGLEIITDIKDEDIKVRADGNLLWRILNNLYSNINKYAMANTRVYIDVSREDDNALISIKNISREQLNISADELMERFVRGDSSRHTEGSGLGLNIASSLAEIQKGSLKLSVDGDLFKTELRMPLA